MRDDSFTQPNFRRTSYVDGVRPRANAPTTNNVPQPQVQPETAAQPVNPAQTNIPSPNLYGGMRRIEPAVPNTPNPTLNPAATFTAVSPASAQPITQPVQQPVFQDANTQPQVGGQSVHEANATKKLSWKRINKKLTLALTLIMVISLGILVSKLAFAATATKTLKNNGYAYSFKFNRTAKEVELSDGTVGYEYANLAVVGATPLNKSLSTACTQFGDTWYAAFSAQINDSETPVCTGDNRHFSMAFPAFGSTHVLNVTYAGQQSADNYPAIQHLFESIKVTKNI